jgi:hypothetical protein
MRAGLSGLIVAAVPSRELRLAEQSCEIKYRRSPAGKFGLYSDLVSGVAESRSWSGTALGFSDGWLP